MTAVVCRQIIARHLVSSREPAGQVGRTDRLVHWQIGRCPWGRITPRRRTESSGFPVSSRWKQNPKTSAETRSDVTITAQPRSTSPPDMFLQRPALGRRLQRVLPAERQRVYSTDYEGARADVTPSIEDKVYLRHHGQRCLDPADDANRRRSASPPQIGRPVRSQASTEQPKDSDVWRPASSTQQTQQTGV